MTSPDAQGDKPAPTAVDADRTFEIVSKCFIGAVVGLVWSIGIWWLSFGLAAYGEGWTAPATIIGPAFLIGPLIGCAWMFRRTVVGRIAFVFALLVFCGADRLLWNEMSREDPSYLKRAQDHAGTAILIWYGLWYGAHGIAVLGLIIQPLQFLPTRLFRYKRRA